MSHGGVLDDYKNLRTLPALLSVAFVATSLYQFGGISDVTLSWFDYTLTTNHAMLASLGVLVVAFASSQTKRFEDYADWEKVAIASAPAAIIAQQHVTEVTDFVANNAPGAEVAMFALTIVGWGVAVR
jgi:hypothetical protein